MIDDDSIVKGEGSFSGSANVTWMSSDDKNKAILDMLDAFLMEPRFDGDDCIILKMPENEIKRHKDKLNAAIWYVYNKHAEKRMFSMFDILVAIESMVGAVKLTTMLDNDIKLKVAAERSIIISETELDEIAANANRKKRDTNEADVDSSETEMNELEEKTYAERLLEVDPDEEAELMKDIYG